MRTGECSTRPGTLELARMLKYFTGATAAQEPFKFVNGVNGSNKFHVLVCNGVVMELY